MTKSGDRQCRIVHYYGKALFERSGVTRSLWAWADLMTAWSQVEVWHGPGAMQPPKTIRPIMSRRLLHLGSNPRFWVPLVRRSRFGEVSCLFLHEGWTVANFVMALRALLSGVPYVLVPHGVYQPEIIVQQRYWHVRIYLERFIIRHASAVHVFYAGEKRLINAVCNARGFIVAPNAIELPSQRWEGGGGYVAWFGRYDPVHKGLDLLVDAIATIPFESRPKVLLRGYDFQGGQERIKQLVARRNLQTFIDVGPKIENEELVSFLTHCSCYVHPSRWESCSLALLETLSLGVPVVLSDQTHAASTMRNVVVVSHLDPLSLGRAISDAVRGPVQGSVDGRREFVTDTHSRSVCGRAVRDALSKMGICP